MSATPPPWLDRAVTELAELKDRIEKLRIFVTGPFFKTVEERSKVDLHHQLTAMEDYAYYLERRIKRVSQ